jgi:hypothetical protein
VSTLQGAAVVPDGYQWVEVMFCTFIVAIDGANKMFKRKKVTAVLFTTASFIIISKCIYMPRNKE